MKRQGLNGKPNPSCHVSTREKRAADDGKPVAQNNEDKVTQVKEESEQVVEEKDYWSKCRKVFDGQKAGPSGISPATGQQAVVSAAAAVKQEKEEPEEQLIAQELGNNSKKVGIKTDDDYGLTEPVSPSKNLTNPELRSSGIKLIDKIMQHMEKDGFMEQLEAHLVSKASEIGQATEFCTSLLHQNVIEETHASLATGPQAQQGRQIERVIKKACSKRAIGSLVLALESSKNDRILLETYIWLETLQKRNKTDSLAVNSLANPPGPTATGIFAATMKGLISVDLRTLQPTALTSEDALSVAVNHKLKKIYWVENKENARIMRSNYDGSTKEVIVPLSGDKH